MSTPHKSVVTLVGEGEESTLLIGTTDATQKSRTMDSNRCLTLANLRSVCGSDVDS